MDTPPLIQGLHSDHINMAQLMRIATQAIEKIAAGESSDLDLLEEIMRYMTGYPDTHHHPTEDVVFEKLRNRVPENSADIDRIEAEHKDLLIKGRRFLELIEAIEDDELVKREVFVNAGQDYFESLDNHMSFEETVLFPAANSTLEEKDWQAVEAKIVESADPLFGPGVEKRYERLLRRIRSHEMALAQ